MNKDLRKFFDAGKELRQKRRRGLFLLVEPDAAVSRWLGKVLLDMSPNTLQKFEGVFGALNFLVQHEIRPAHKKPVKCVIVNAEVVGKQSPIELLTYVENNNPEVVCIAYTRNAVQAEMLQRKFPRITVIYNSDGVRTLLESLDVQLAKCCLQKRA